MVPQGWASYFLFFLQKLKRDILPSLTKSRNFVPVFFPVKINWCSHWFQYLESQSKVLNTLFIKEEGLIFSPDTVSPLLQNFAWFLLIKVIMKQQHGIVELTILSGTKVLPERFLLCPVILLKACHAHRANHVQSGITVFANYFPSPRTIYNGKKGYRKF